MSNKKDVVVTRGMLDEAAEAIIEGVSLSINQAVSHATQNITNNITNHMDTKFKHQKDDIDGLKAEFANTPSREEFVDLKKRVQKLEKSQLSN